MGKCLYNMKKDLHLSWLVSMKLLPWVAFFRLSSALHYPLFGMMYGMNPDKSNWFKPHMRVIDFRMRATCPAEKRHIRLCDGLDQLTHSKHFTDVFSCALLLHLQPASAAWFSLWPACSPSPPPSVGPRWPAVGATEDHSWTFVSETVSTKSSRTLGLKQTSSVDCNGEAAEPQ